MTKKRSAVTCPRDPIGLGLDEAAAFLSISTSLFDRMMREGIFPPPRQLGQRLIWDADELITAFRRIPHRTVDLRPGASPMHHYGRDAEDPYDRPPRA